MSKVTLEGRKIYGQVYILAHDLEKLLLNDLVELSKEKGSKSLLAKDYIEDLQERISRYRITSGG